MGKTKQDKKFDRNVEISAPILDPEIIKQIHSPPKDKRRDISHGGFKALLSDLNSQDSTDELTPITDNHLPSYIGISCAVSGYSNYRLYNRMPSGLDSASKTANTTNVDGANRSHTNSPVNAPTIRVDQHQVNHISIDKSAVSSVDQERRLLTEKLTASATERRRSPSPVAPTEDDRHHGAYVGARYFPMPEPSKVNKHIPLLGIDDDLDPNEQSPEEALNNVEQKIASLYGEPFVEDWKCAMSHKSRKEFYDDKQTAETKRTPLNLKDLVSLKPTPPKESEPVEVVDVPTPNVKVLANVEKQFLNRLLSDDNPPMPKSPSPQPASPTSPRLTVSPIKANDSSYFGLQESGDQRRAPLPPPQEQHQQSESPEFPSHKPVADESLTNNKTEDVLTLLNSSEVDSSASFQGEPYQPHEAPNNSQKISQILAPEPDLQSLIDMVDSPVEPDLADTSSVKVEVGDESPRLLDEVEHELADELRISGEVAESNAGEQSELEAPNEEEHLEFAYISSELQHPKSPDSQISSSTVERAPLRRNSPQALEDLNSYSNDSDEIGDELSPAGESEKPDCGGALDDQSSLVTAREVVTQDSDNLLSFSPDLDPELNAETNNNVESQLKGVSDESCGEGPAGSSDECETASAAADAALAAFEAAGSPKQEDYENRDGHYFLNLLGNEESFIREQVRSAEQTLAERESELDEETLGRIHSAVGKANLLINKKCNQFRELCEKSIYGDASDQYAVLNDDLAGFWDMICIQISDVRKSLENL